MLSPSQLERASAAYRRGYYDGYYGRPTPAGTMPPDYSFAARDYDEGRRAGANDRLWAVKHPAPGTPGWHRLHPRGAGERQPDGTIMWMTDCEDVSRDGEEG
jgi:hypothetical protein